MNLRALANSVTSAINPNASASLFISTGYAKNAQFQQIPTYSLQSVNAQVQPLTSGDLRFLDGLNIQGAQKAVYLNGSVLAISRVKKFGGDIIVFPNGTMPEGNVWLTLASLEQWGGTWCKVAVILQDDTAAPSLGGPSLDFSYPNNSQYLPGIS